MCPLSRRGRAWRSRSAAGEPRSASSQTVTYKGQAIIHDDEETKAWFYPELAARVRPESADQQKAFVDHLATEGRVVIEIVPDGRIGFDAEEMFRGSPAGSSRTEV